MCIFKFMKHSLCYKNLTEVFKYQLYELRPQSQAELNPTSSIICWCLSYEKPGPGLSISGNDGLRLGQVTVELLSVNAENT